jgi:hypothetical protein
MTQDLGETNPALVDWFRDAAPVGRLGVPQDLSPTVCHLLSEAGSFISGTDILITGRLHCHAFWLSTSHIFVRRYSRWTTGPSTEEVIVDFQYSDTAALFH